MNKIDEYKEYLRDWEITIAYLGMVFLALCVLLFVQHISPVYYQFNAIMTLVILMAMVLVMMIFTRIRCDELVDKIVILEQEAGVPA